MTWAATAIVGGSLAGAYIGGQASKSAARTSQQAADTATAEQRRQFDITQQNLAPYRDVGTNALYQLAGQTGRNIPGSELPQFNYLGTLPQLQASDLPTYQQTALPQAGANQQYRPQQEFQSGAQITPYTGGVPALQNFQSPGNFAYDLQSDPGYKFALDQAMNQATRGAAAQGKLGSGNLLAELSDRAAGIASQYANDAFNRQLATSQENYGRARDVNAINNQLAQSRFGMGTAANQLANQNALSQYGMDTTGYGLNTQRAKDIYNAGLTGYGLDYQRAMDLNNLGLNQYNLDYQKARDLYGTNYQQQQDLYNRALGQYGLGYQRASDIYNRGQTNLNWLANLAGIGQNSTNTGIAAGQGMANQIGNIAMANAANRTSAIGAGAGSLNNAIQGGISNWLGYQQNQNLMNMLKPQTQYTGPLSPGYQYF